MTSRAREQQVRRMARLQGLTLVKSRTRTPGAPDFGRYWLNEIVPPGMPAYTVPIGGEESLFTGSALAEAEAYLRSGSWWRTREERAREREREAAIARNPLREKPLSEPLSEPGRAGSEPLRAGSEPLSEPPPAAMSRYEPKRDADGNWLSVPCPFPKLPSDHD